MVATLISNPDAGSGIGRGISVTPLINQIQSSLDDVNSVRANLGAIQNRMDFTMRSLDISSENLQDSESRVRNADVAREMMRFTMANVLQQAAVSMLSQANQMPNNLLQLLR
jgi:flagellin